MFSEITCQKNSSPTYVSLMLLILSFLIFEVSPLSAAPLRLDANFTPSFTHTQVGFAYLTDIKELNDGRIMVGGWYDFVNGTPRGRIARLNSDGSLDTGFNPGVGVDNDVKAIEVQADNKVIVVGYFSKVNNITKNNVARLNADGSVDTSFTANTDSSVWDISQGESTIYDPFSALSGHFFLGGQFTSVNGSERRHVAKLTPAGSLDTSFNTGAGITSGTRVWTVAALPESKVLVGGDFTAFNSSNYSNLVRLSASGAVDTSFSIGSGANSIVTSLAVQPDGKYLVGGAFTTFNNTGHSGIVRLLNTGAIDPSFNCNVTGGYGEIRSISLQSDGHILIGGNFTTVNGFSRLNIARLNPDGSLDMEFGPEAVTNEIIYTVAVLGQNQVVVGGKFTAINGQAREKIGRFAVDPSLGGAAANPHTLFAGGKDDWRRVNLPKAFVNTGSLDVLAEGTLFYMSTLGPSLFARLSYNSFLYTESTGSFGSHWRFLYESSLTQQGPTQVVLQKGAGDRETFLSNVDLATATPASPVILSPLHGNFNQLTSYGTYLLYKEKDTGFVYRFDAPALGQKAYLTEVADKNNNALTVSVDLATGRISSITDSANRQLLFTYTTGRCSKITIPDGRTIEFTYDTSGQLIQIKDMMGYLGRYTYTDGYLTSTNIGGDSTTYTYSDKEWGNGKYVSKVTAANGTTQIEPLNGSANQVRWTTPTGSATIVASTAGKTAGTKDPLGAMSSFSYVDGLPTSFSDANGKTKVFEYDSRGNITKATDALSYSFLYFYDVNDNLIERRDALGKKWLYEYDVKNNLTKISYPNGATDVFAYDALGRMTSYVDKRGKQTSYTYDSYGNLLNTTYPDNGVLKYSYDSTNAYTRCSKIVDTRNKEKYYTYDANNRITEISYGSISGIKVTYTYDALSLLSVKDERGFTTRVERNDFGLITRLIDPLNASTKFQYDANNNLIQLEDALGRVSKTTFDAANHPSITTDPMNHDLKRYYDLEGNLTSIIDQRSKTTHFTYDDNNRLKTVSNPLDHSISNTYDANGRLASVENAKGAVVAYSYDSVGNMLTKSFNGTLQVAYSYDNAGNLTNANHSTIGSTAHTFDEKGRIKTITWPDAKTVTYGYDTEGNMTSVTYPDGLVVSSQYDSFCRRKLPVAFRHGPVDDISPYKEKANQATSIAWTGNSMDFEYDQAANLIKETRSNNTVSSYTFNAKRKVTNVKHSLGLTSFLTLTNTYDVIGNVSTSLNTGMIPPPFTSMAVSNSFDNANSMTSFGSTAYTSDLDGNVTAIGSSFSASYDTENKIVSSTMNGITTTYSYDGSGRPYRIVKGGVTSYYHWDTKGRLLFITDATGTLLVRYVYRGVRLVAQQVQSGDWYYYHFDTIGNTLALTDGNGQVVTNYAYNLFGLKAVTGTAVFNPFTFVGQYGTVELADGIYLMGNRLYNASTGRFLQRDPLGMTGGLNLFVYAGNNPINSIDPEGTEEVDPEDMEDEPEEQQPKIKSGTADLNSGELPEDGDAKDDKVVFDAIGDIGSSVAKTAEDLQELSGNIPLLPIPGNNFVTAARRARDGKNGEAAWEVTKGVISLVPGYGQAAGAAIDIGEALIKIGEASSQSPPSPIYKQQFVR